MRYFRTKQRPLRSRSLQFALVGGLVALAVPLVALATDRDFGGFVGVGLCCLLNSEVIAHGDSDQLAGVATIGRHL